MNDFFLLFNVEHFMNFHSSLHRGPANLLCIIPILVYVLPKWAQYITFLKSARHFPYIISLNPQKIPGSREDYLHFTNQKPET